MHLVGLRTDIAALARIADSFASVPDANTGIRSPFAGDLSRIVVPDLLSLFGIDDWSCFGREHAMSLPGVFRARAILLSLIADKPMNGWRGETLLPIDEQPKFLHRTPGILGPWQRMARTLDDLFFYPWSLWMTQRGAERNGRKDILNAVHVPYESWQVNEIGLIELKNSDGGWDVADEDEVILIPGPSEGLIAYAVRTLRGSAAIEDAWVTRARNPSPITELHLTEDIPLTDTEVTETRDAYVNARRSSTGAVMVTPQNIEVIDHGGDADAQLYIEGRNASRLDIAAFFNLPGAILDATTATASLTYVTQEGTRTSVYDLSLPYWVRPIESRLSQDDIVASGQSVRFDFSSLAPTTPAIVTED
jgi:hypothetical protein